MPVIDLKPAASRLAELDHIHGLTHAFGGATEKANGETSTMGPQGRAANLPADWRTSIPRKLDELAAKWDDPEAWTGTTTVGGQGMPAEAMGVIAYGELTVHARDLAQGQRHRIRVRGRHT